MKVAILAGGFGTRLAEHTDITPKPMVEIGGRPILWHIMHLYAHHGFNDFIIALGYKGEVIKDYFLNYAPLESDFSVELATGKRVSLNDNQVHDWKVTLVDTGLNTMTGGRIARLRPYLNGETFMLTYGDGVSDVDIGKLVAFHRAHGRMATLTAVHPKAHYGELEMDGDRVKEFMEKPQFRQSWINGGFMVLDQAFIDLIESDQTVFEREPMKRATAANQVLAYRHTGFWQCMDTLRDVQYLNSLWESGNPPWAVWR